MNSNGWKFALIAVAALSLSACGPHKKKNKPGSPFTGIWIEETSAAMSLRGQAAQGCNAGVAKPFAVHPNGQVFAYVPAEARADVLAPENFLGSVNAAAQFNTTDGVTRHAMAAGVYSGALEATLLIPRSTLFLNGDVLIVSGYGGQRRFVGISERTARDLWASSAGCASRRPVVVQQAPPGAYGPPIVTGEGQLGPDDGYDYGTQNKRRAQKPQVNQDDK